MNRRVGHRNEFAEESDAGLVALSDLEPADLRVLPTDGKAPSHQAYVLKK